jgi:plasmid maintenance system antidote protein VapI
MTKKQSQSPRDMIIKAMNERQWSMYKLAQESGVHYMRVHNFVKGKSDIMFESGLKILKALDLLDTHDPFSEGKTKTD